MSNLVSVCNRCHKKLEAIGFKILENGGSRTDVRKTELRMIAEAKQKRYKDYQKKLLENKNDKTKKE